jgi:archaellum biogenesis ATPase FlaH|tara:strand:+ start:72 stop:1448 length:1377 start_codon:yes stop_codon:yes gene_type:complete
MGQADKASLSKYGKNFQEKFCQLLLQERTFCDQILEVFDIEFLELKYLRVFVSKILDYKEEFNIHPSFDTLATILRSDLEDENDAVQKQTRDFFARIYKSDMTVDGEEYIKKTSLDFCKKQKLKEAMLKSVKLLQNSSFDEMAEVINNALKLGADNDYGYDYLQDFEERFVVKARDPITTGWRHVDEICKGGLGKGELGVVIAPTGAGKSMALVHLGAKALQKGKNVVHYTLELSSTVVASRYDSCITKVPLQDVYNFKDLIYEKVKDIDGKLIVKEYPTKSASPKTIKNHLEKLRQRGVEVDLIIIDYGDLLRPSIIRKEKRHELETIYEDLRAIAHEQECPIWTASQTNRSGLNAEVITMESISEAFNKCFVADFIFTISRTVEDKTTNTGRMFVAKNRNGPDGLVFPLSMDTSNVYIDVLRKVQENAGDLIVKTAKEQKDVLREKYKKYMKGGAQ